MAGYSCVCGGVCVSWWWLVGGGMEVNVKLCKYSWQTLPLPVEVWNELVFVMAHARSEVGNPDVSLL